MKIQSLRNFIIALFQAAELMDIDRQSVSLALNVENTNLPYDSRMNMDMQGNNTMRDPDASREEIATSLLLPNVSYNRTVQGSLLPDTTQFNERGPPVEVPQEMTRYTDIPIDMLEISEVPNSTTEGFNASIERTPIMVEDPPESQETKERNRILRFIFLKPYITSHSQQLLLDITVYVVFQGVLGSQTFVSENSDGPRKRRERR